MTENCVPLDAYGSNEAELEIPVKLVYIIENLMMRLKKTDSWMNEIENILKQDVECQQATVMKNILSSQLIPGRKLEDEISTNELIWALLWFFRIDCWCYNQNSLATRLATTKALDQPSKHHFLPCSIYLQ